RDVEDDGTEVRVRRTLHELVRLRIVVAPVDLEVITIHRADAAMQLRVLDGPAEDLLRRSGVPDVVDDGVVVDEARDVRVGAIQILLELDVRRFPRRRVGGDVRETVDLLAATFLLVEVGDSHAGVLSRRQGGKAAQRSQYGRDVESAHPVFSYYMNEGSGSSAAEASEDAWALDRSG